MREILILRCSPHADGVTDRLASYFASGLAGENYPVRDLALRDFSFNSCDGCNYCLKAPHICKFQEKDDLSFLYSVLQNSSLAVFVSPVYFYALPAICAAFIDRAQALWNKGQSDYSARYLPPGIALFAAGRANGLKLFTGAALCISCFFRAAGSALIAKYAFRQLENLPALESRPGIKTFLCKKGRDWARYVTLNELS